MADAGHQAEGVHDDVEKLASYFVKTYKTLEAADSQIDHDHDWDIREFKAELKRWGVLIADADELFYHIDADYSGRISWLEILSVLSQPVAEVKAREERRQSAEVTAIYEELAEKIRTDFHGSVEEAFKAVGAGGEREISISGFSRLIKMVHMELSPAQVSRVFHRIDENRSENISIQELKNALSYYLVRGMLVDIAAHLTERDGSVSAAFEGGINRAAAAGAFPASPTSGSGFMPLDGSIPLLEKDFLTLLRKLKVLVEGDGAHSFMSKGSAVFLFATLQGSTFTSEDFKERLEKVHGEEQKRKDDIEQQRARKEQLKKQRAFAELPGIGGVVARKRQAGVGTAWRTEVDAWTAEAARAAQAGGEMKLQDVTRLWELDARSGKSKAQLQDYKFVLEHALCQRQSGPGGLQELQDEVAGRWEGLRASDGSPISPESVMTNSFAMSAGKGRTPLGMVGDRVLEQTRVQQQAAVKAKRLIQAAAVGDVAGVQAVLKQRADVNLAGWGGVTPLMTAARHGREATLRMLLASQADVGRTDSHGRTAVDHAQRAPVALRSGAVNFLKACGGLSGQEMKAQVDALARRVFEIETECSKLNNFKGQLPTRDDINESKALLRKTITRGALARTMSRDRGAGDLTPRSLTPMGSPRLLEDDMPGGPSFAIPAAAFGASGYSPSLGPSIFMPDVGPGPTTPFNMRAGGGTPFGAAGLPHRPPLLPIPAISDIDAGPPIGRQWSFGGM